VDTDLKEAISAASFCLAAFRLTTNSNFRICFYRQHRGLDTL
jgi:hypothetical protein